MLLGMCGYDELNKLFETLTAVPLKRVALPAGGACSATLQRQPAGRGGGARSCSGRGGRWGWAGVAAWA